MKISKELLEQMENDDKAEMEELTPSQIAAYEEMENYFNDSLGRFRASQIIMGKVIAISNGLATIDVGFKSEGMVSLSEFPEGGKNLEMGLGGDAINAVDGDDVLGAGGEGYHAVHLGTQRNGISRPGHRGLERHSSVRRHRYVHEQVPGTGCLRRRQTQLGQGRRQIIGAVVVITLTAQKLVAIPVASGQKGVVDPRRVTFHRGVFHQGQDRPAVIGDHAVAHPRHDPAQKRPGMLHGHELRQIIAAKRPGIHNLLPVGIDHSDPLACLNEGRFAAARWNGDQVGSCHI